MATYLHDEDTKPSGSTGERLVAKLPERIQRQPVSRILAGLLAILASIALLIALLSSPGSDEQKNDAAASDPAPTVAGSEIEAPPAAAAAVDVDVAPAPGMDPDLAPPDGPGPDSPPFGVDALAMRDELRPHPPDEDDHNHTVEGRGPQARVVGN